MGFSLPAAMGAAFGLRAQNNDTPVISINGDGGVVMNAQELSVAAAHGLPLKIFVMNNNFLGMVRQWQELFHENRFSHTDLTNTNPDFVKLAEAHHCVGLRATSTNDIQETIERAWQINDRPVVVECQVVKEEMVFPMVPSGASSDAMITKRLTPNAFV
jgi:acetolactate synthase-1/2/3 large subunit